MKQYRIRKSNESKLGYELAISDNGKVSTIQLNRKTTDNYLYMPDEVISATNRRLISMAMIDKTLETNDEFVITSKAPTIKSPNGTTKKSSTKWTEFLTDEEKKTIEDIKSKCEQRMNDPLTIALRELEAAKARVEELKKQQAGK